MYTLAQQAVHQYGGTLHSVTGDRLLAVFGAPLAQEDHARRAVLAACRFHQRLATCRDPAGDQAEVPLEACIGLHMGLIIVGGIGDAEEPVAVVGDLPLAVEALQAQAAPGTTLCSNATGRLVQGDIDLEGVPPVPVPGQPTPLHTYQVLGLRLRDVSGVGAALRARSPFVGRAHELATLHAVLAQVEAGRGQVVGIVGEPGIGKSRLLAEFHHGLGGRPLRYLHGRCLAYGQAIPYLPVRDLLRHFCDLTAAESLEGITAKLYHRLREVGMAPEETAVYLLALLDDRLRAGPRGLAAPP